MDPESKRREALRASSPASVPRAGRGRSLIVALAAVLAGGFGTAHAEDLLQIYREALANDPTLASAQASWQATQELVPQARAGLLPSVTLVGNANGEHFYERLHTDPSLAVTQNFPLANYTVSASQPLFRRQNQVALDQAKQSVGQSDFVLASARQDLIVRVAQAYLDVLLARFNIELTESQKAAVSENLAQAKRNFEVGTATITDTNDAQAKYDQIVAQQISAQNDLDNKIAALRAIIGRAPGELKRFGGVFTPQLPTPNALDAWIDAAVRDNPQVRIAQANYDIAVLEVERQRAGHYPTVDLVASFNQGYAGATPSIGGSFSNIANDSRTGVIGVQLNVPLYLGGSIESRVRQAVANLDKARQDLEGARRSAQLSAQNAFSGVTSGVAQINAFDQAVKSAQVSYESTRVGLEVGVRTNLDVLNQQQQVFQTRFNLAQSYYNFVINGLRLKQAVGTLTDADIEEINRALGG
jgi:outer membrane protein